MLRSQRSTYRRLLIQLGLLLMILSCGSGCGPGLKAAGVSPWPILPEVQVLELGDHEKARLLAWRENDKVLFDRIQKQGAQMRAIISAYNEQARSNNRRILDSLGYDKKLLEDIYRHE